MHAFFDIFNRIGIGKPQVTLAIGSEINPGRDADPVEHRQHLDHEPVRQLGVGLEVHRAGRAAERRTEAVWQQLEVDSWVQVSPTTLDGIRAFLASGRVRGIGPKMAERIVAADLSANGEYDLVVEERNGSLHVWENAGSASAPIAAT